jgi:hypothetical protein
MGFLLEMGVRRSKKFIKKRSIGGSGVHGAHQALARRLITFEFVAYRLFDAVADLSMMLRKLVMR